MTSISRRLITPGAAWAEIQLPIGSQLISARVVADKLATFWTHTGVPGADEEKWQVRVDALPNVGADSFPDIESGIFGSIPFFLDDSILWVHKEPVGVVVGGQLEYAVRSSLHRLAQTRRTGSSDTTATD